MYMMEGYRQNMDLVFFYRFLINHLGGLLKNFLRYVLKILV